jgi:hypothetical protein
MKLPVSSEFIPRLFRKWLATAKSGAFTSANFGGSAPLISTSGFTRLQVDNAYDFARAIFTAASKPRFRPVSALEGKESLNEFAD